MEGHSDFSVAVFNHKTGKTTARASWCLRKNDIRPYLKFKMKLANQWYYFTLFPNRQDSYPTAAVIRRELVRESIIRAEREGGNEWIEIPDGESETP